MSNDDKKQPGKMQRIWDKIKPSKKHKKGSDASTKSTKSTRENRMVADTTQIPTEDETTTGTTVSCTKSAVEIMSPPNSAPTPKAGIVKSAEQMRPPDVTIYQTVVTKIQPAKSSFKKKKKNVSKKKKPDKQPQSASSTQSMSDVWEEFAIGQRFPPASTLVCATGKPFKSLPGESTSQYVACRYLHGDPVMGRVWNDGGKITASFTAGGREIRGNKIVNKILVLQSPDDAAGVTYEWKPFTEVVSFDSSNRVWNPVLVGHQTPGLICVGDAKILGQVDIKNEKASYGFNGEQKDLLGPEVRKSIILCRKNR